MSFKNRTTIYARLHIEIQFYFSFSIFAFPFQLTLDRKGCVKKSLRALWLLCDLGGSFLVAAVLA
ncbi:hypothetical protein [Caldithrix abyssi]|uniref:hypothetical protein n=1 Tax=Caldithrix abyssi TaxID=187145 RepID=UPI0012376E4C|nr:hypothetical protein [Caldithrix abyssi]